MTQKYINVYNNKKKIKKKAEKMMISAFLIAKTLEP